MSATAWASLLDITQGGNNRTLEFNVPTIVNNEPNLDPATSSPYTNFDPDFGGMSYGAYRDSGSGLLDSMTALSARLSGPEADLDGDGNLSVSDGSGLVSIPLQINRVPDGEVDNGLPEEFLITITSNVNPGDEVVFTGVAYKDNSEDGIAVHTLFDRNNSGDGDGFLEVYETVQGDADLSGNVDLADLGIFLANLGSTGLESAADNGWGQANWTGDDGIVDLADLGLFLANLGTVVDTGHTHGGGSPSAVPEPSTMLLAGLGLMGFAVRRRRRSR